MRLLRLWLRKSLVPGNRLHDQKRHASQVLQALLKSATNSVMRPQNLLYLKRAPAHSLRRIWAHQRQPPHGSLAQSKLTGNRKRLTSSQHCAVNIVRGPPMCSTVRGVRPPGAGRNAGIIVQAARHAHQLLNADQICSTLARIGSQVHPLNMMRIDGEAVGA